MRGRAQPLWRDDAEALRWIETLQNLGEALPSDYEVKRPGWLEAL